jgi:hypothetical protein
MARILIGWELGSERGHAALVEPVAEALLERGHQVRVLAREIDAFSPRMIARLGAELRPAPGWPAPRAEPLAPVSQTLGDDLVHVGLAGEGALRLRAQAWVDAIDAHGAELVLAECAPTLLLAAGNRCPAIAFGSGYSLPPPGCSLPAVLDNQRRPADSSLAAEVRLHHAFDAVDRALGGGGLALFSDLYSVPTWVCNLPELDPYGALRAAPAPGPLRLPFHDERAPANRPPRPAGERVFVYVKPFPGLPDLLDALAPQCAALEVYIPNLPHQVDNPWRHVTLHRQPLDLARCLPEFTAVVHFGGMNLAAEALLAGVPQLIVSQHLEQGATALAVQRLGVGRAAMQVPREPGREAERQALLTGVVADFFAATELPGRAAAVGAGLRARQKPSLPGLMDLCEELLA